MKKICLTLLSAGMLSVTSQAQVPVKKSVSLVHKITATWCGPCGDWGWQLADEIRTATADKALYVSLFASASSSNGNTDFYNTTALTLANQITFGGYPDFGVNAIEKTEANSSTSGLNVNGIKTDCIAAVDAFATTTPVTSAASIMTISGNTVTVNAKVQFWSAASGEYYLASYIIEDGAMHIQNGQGGSPVAHHGVLRTSMTAASAWGEQIATGSIAANQTYSKTFTFTVTDVKWDKSKFKIYNVIWKKEGGVYKFMNANVNGTATSIEDVVNTTGVSVYPNPAADILNINIDAVKASDVSCQVTNILGQQVLPTVNIKLNQGANRQSINTTALAAGTYMLNIHTRAGSIERKFVKK